MDLSTPDAVNLALTFIVPGFVLHSTLSVFSVRRPDGGELNLIRFLTFSAMNYATWSWLIYLFIAPDVSQSWKAAGWFWVILAGPALLGVFWAFIQQKEWVYTFLQRAGLKPIHVIPTSWDWRFSKMKEPHWILVTLKDGSMVSGWFGSSSFASSDSSERDLYIEQLYEIGDEGKWVPTAEGKGSLISGDQIRSIELWPTKTIEEELA